MIVLHTTHVNTNMAGLASGTSGTWQFAQFAQAGKGIF